jgi:hypothetical protein
MIETCISKARTRFVDKEGKKGAKEEGNSFALMRMPDRITSLFAPRPIKERSESAVVHRRLSG